MRYKNDLVLRAARGEMTERTPVWLMRQAGRVLPEYRAIRSKVSGFKELVKTPELAAEVTLQPVDLLGVDAAIIFSDILVVPEAMGLPYEMVEQRGPWFSRTISTSRDLKNIHIPETETLQYVYEAIQITKSALNYRVPLIGFAGAPWTIFAYMVEGSGSKTFSKARKMLYTEEKMANKLLEMITQTTVQYLKAQIRAGVDIIQIFDSWAGVLPPEHFEHFSLKYISEICEKINEVPIIVFAKGAGHSLEKMKDLNCNVISLDWQTHPLHAKIFMANKTLQGNLDPCVLYSSKKRIKEETIKMLNQYQGIPHIANLGHGIYPDTSPDHVRYFIEEVKKYGVQ